MNMIQSFPEFLENSENEFIERYKRYYGCEAGHLQEISWILHVLYGYKDSDIRDLENRIDICFGFYDESKKMDFNINILAEQLIQDAEYVGANEFRSSDGRKRMHIEYYTLKGYSISLVSDIEFEGDKFLRSVEVKRNER